MTNQISAELAAILAVADDNTHTNSVKLNNNLCIKIWRNAARKVHRDGDLPAMIWSTGSVAYYKDGIRHRGGDLPAVIYADGSVYYYKNGLLMFQRTFNEKELS